MSNVLRHPAAGLPPVSNPPRRGRLPANVAKLPARKSKHTATPESWPSPSVATIVVHDGAVTVHNIDISSKADAVEMLMWLYIHMGEVLQDLNRFGWGPR